MNSEEIARGKPPLFRSPNVARTGVLLAALILLSRAICTAQTGPQPMMNHSPVWSPTENLIVFDSDRDGDSEVYTINPNTGALRKLTDNTTADGAARWARDGKHILFKSDRDGTTKTLQMRTDGSEQKVAADQYDESVEAVSPDGRTVLFVATKDGKATIFARTTDGRITQLTHGAHASQPSFSPDGLHIAYEETLSAILVMNRDGSNQRRLADGTDPSWSPNGSLILFKTPSSQVGGYGWEVATIRPDGSLLTRLSPGVHPSWSPDGLRIAFMRETSAERSDIWVMNRDGTNRTCLTCVHRGG